MTILVRKKAWRDDLVSKGQATSGSALKLANGC